MPLAPPRELNASCSQGCASPEGRDLSYSVLNLPALSLFLCPSGPRGEKVKFPGLGNQVLPPGVVPSLLVSCVPAHFQELAFY